MNICWDEVELDEVSPRERRKGGRAEGEGSWKVVGAAIYGHAVD